MDESGSVRDWFCVSIKPKQIRLNLTFASKRFFCAVIMCDVSDPEGPSFLVEPPSHVDFSNNTGVKLDCMANGVPQPTVEWLQTDGSRVTTFQRLRHVLANGTLILSPFRAEDYVQDVHATTYKCMASSSIGVILTRDIRIRAATSSKPTNNLEFKTGNVYGHKCDVTVDHIGVMRVEINQTEPGYCVVQ
uniref:Ig-like domain-containing protein n=1 Tax=Strigamia maritima TaxID=126957 RepID=T1IRM2_STRMM